MATYYISTTGNDSTGNGSSGNPWATIGKFGSSGASGDTLIIKNGTYTNQVGTQSLGTKNMTVQAETSGLVILDGSGTNFLNLGPTNSASVLTLNLTGIEFKRYANNGHGVFIQSPSVLNCTNCSFHDIVFDNVANGGLLQTGQGIAAGSHVHTIASCLIYNNTYAGAGAINALLHEFNDLGLAVNFNFTNCTVSISGGVYFGNTYRPTFTLKNTIFYETSSTAFSGGAGVPNASTALNCDFYNYTVHANIVQTACISSDPLMIDPVNGILRIRPSSPCYDAGTIL